MKKKENIKVKTPKLTALDREKIYADKEMLIILIKSFAASCRYGANTRWCVSTPSNQYNYNSFAKRNLIFIVINYNPDRTEKKKICIIHPKRLKKGYKFSFFNERDNDISDDYFLGLMLGDKFDIIKEFVDKNRMQFKPNQVSGMQVGDLLKGKSDTTLTFLTKQKVYPPKKIKLMTEGRMRYNRYWELKKRTLLIHLPIKALHIAKAEVIKINVDSVTIKLIELSQDFKGINLINLDKADLTKKIKSNKFFEKL